MTVSSFTTATAITTANSGITAQGSNLVSRGLTAGRIVLASVFATVLGFSSVSLQAQGSPFDGLDLGSLDPGSLVVLEQDPIALEALKTIRVELPLDLEGANPILILAIDPDGNPATDNSFALPIQLNDLLGEEGGELLGLIGAGDEIISGDELDLITGLSGVLDGLLGGLLGTLFGLGDELALDDLVDELNGAVVTGIGIDIQSLLSYVLNSTLTIVGLDQTLVAEVEAAVVQPDVTVGRNANRNLHIGNNTYSDGSGQTLRTPKSSKGRTNIHFTFENDGNATDTLVAQSRSFGARPQEKRVVWRGANVTGAFRAGTFRADLAPGAIMPITVLDQTPRNRVGKSRPVQSFAITVKSTTDGSKFDRAEALSNLKPKRR